MRQFEDPEPQQNKPNQEKHFIINNKLECEETLSDKLPKSGVYSANMKPGYLKEVICGPKVSQTTFDNIRTFLKKMAISNVKSKNVKLNTGNC